MSFHNGASDDASKSRSASSLPFSYATRIPSVIHVKSKFDSEFRRFCIYQKPDSPMSCNEFRQLIEKKHLLKSIPFTLCYTSGVGDLLPITNDENFHKAFESANPTLRILVQRKGESWEEKYGYGTGTLDRKKKGLSSWIPTTNKPPHRSYNISNPEDFRQVSAIIDVDLVPESLRRVRLCKHGSDRPLGFYIRQSSLVKQTPQGPVKYNGITISKLLEGGLAESTGLLSVNDEIVEVNGIEVSGKTIDQVTDMMIANSHNLIVTIKPANQRNTVNRGFRQPSEHFDVSRVPAGKVLAYNHDESDSDSDIDEIVHHTAPVSLR